MPKTFPAPSKEIRPPDGTTHQLHVRQLETYLIHAAKSPQAPQMKVQKRRELCFGHVSTGSMKSQGRVHPVDFDRSEAKWLSVGA